LNKYYQVGKRQTEQSTGRRPQQANLYSQPEQQPGVHQETAKQPALQFTERQQAAGHPAQTDMPPDDTPIAETPHPSTLPDDRRVPSNRQGANARLPTPKTRQYRKGADKIIPLMGSAEKPAVPQHPGETVRPDSAPALKPDKSGKLQFAPDEAVPDRQKAHHNRKRNKAQV
jgi:hypothetical protein